MTRAYSSSTEMPSSRYSGSSELERLFLLMGRPRPAAATAMATICWARTSNALRGTTVGSIRPSCMRRATTAHSSRSPRNFGKIRPRLTSPTPCPARPIRCRPRGDGLGRLDLQHEVDRAHVDPELQRGGGDEARQLARLQQLLDLRALLARERAVVGARDLAQRLAGLAASPSQPRRRLVIASAQLRRGELVQRSATRSAERRLLTNTIVELCSRTSRSSSG